MANVLREARLRGHSLHQVAPGVIGRISDAVTPQPVLAVAPFVDCPLEAIPPGSFFAVLVSVSDPGNAGTIIRSAFAAGASGVVLCENSVDLYNPKTVRASAGAVFCVPVAISPALEDVGFRLREMGYRLVGTSPRATEPYWRAPLHGKVALVFGGEASGLAPGHLSEVDKVVTIPMNPGAESVNVAVAASVVMFEAHRQSLDRRDGR